MEYYAKLVNQSIRQSDIDRRKVTLQERFIGSLSRILGPLKHYLPQFSQVYGGSIQIPLLRLRKEFNLVEPCLRCLKAVNSCQRRDALLALSAMHK